MNSIISTCSHFWTYQRTRFPVIILGISFIPAILSSGAVVASGFTWGFVVSSLAGSIAYLLHIRVSDEYRDISHDTIYHADRPIPSGVITLSELGYIDRFAILVLIVVAVAHGIQAIIVASVMLSYSHVAKHEFFFGERLRKHFFLYNGVNLVQMLLLQVFIYTLVKGIFDMTPLIFYHFCFTSLGTLIFEFLRKVKTPGSDGTGQDTYTWYLGFGRSLVIYVFLMTACVLTWGFLMGQVGWRWDALTVPLMVGIILTYLTIPIHWKKQEERSSGLMQLTFVILYAVCNVLIFASV